MLLYEGFRKIALIFLFAAACDHSGQALAQAVGTVVGTIMHSAGAVIPQAKVTATRTATQVTQSTLSGSAGRPTHIAMRDKHLLAWFLKSALATRLKSF